MFRLTYRLCIIIICFSLGSCASVKLERISNYELKENTTYTVRKPLDLQGKILYFPKGCMLSFKGGSLSNGTVVFESTKIKGKPVFRNCNYKGSILLSRIDDRDFTSQDETGTFKFLFSNAIINGAACDFYRDYRISMEGVSPSGLMSFQSINSGAEIVFHDCSIYNTFAFTESSIRPVIVLCDFRSITIRNCSFHDIAAHNTHLHKESMGCTFIHCYGDCEGINLLDCKQENGDCILRSGVWIHDKKHPERTPSIGISNSTLRVQSLNAGYGLALYCGDNLNIEVEAESPHRGFYCSGVSNTIINYTGYNPKETKCHILVKDAVYRRQEANGKEVIDMKGCHNLVIKANVKDLLSGESVLLFQSYGSGRKEGADFRFRTEKCHHYNIDYSADIKHYPSNGFFIICGVYSDSGALDDNDMFGCKVSGVTIHDIKAIGGEATQYMCNIGSFTESDISITDCYMANENTGFNIQVTGNAKGRVIVKGGQIGNVLVRKKETGEFNVELDDSQMHGVVHYINDKSSKQLVRVRQLQ